MLHCRLQRQLCELYCLWPRAPLPCRSEANWQEVDDWFHIVETNPNTDENQLVPTLDGPHLAQDNSHSNCVQCCNKPPNLRSSGEDPWQQHQRTLLDHTVPQRGLAHSAASSLNWGQPNHLASDLASLLNHCPCENHAPSILDRNQCTLVAVAVEVEAQVEAAVEGAESGLHAGGGMSKLSLDVGRRTCTDRWDRLESTPGAIHRFLEHYNHNLSDYFLDDGLL